MRVTESTVTVSTPAGEMQCGLWVPVSAAGDKFPGLVFFSEIFQLTGPIKRTCALLAGHGFVVLAPEVYHELLPAGTVLAYTPEDTARGNAAKTARPRAAYDGDAAAAVAALRAHASCTGAVGAAGVCLGGGLAFRCAVTQPSVAAAVCWYPTDIHKGAGCTPDPPGGFASDGDDSLARVRAGALKGEVMMVYGRQDPHVPLAGRRIVADALEAGGAVYEWHEYNAAHAFLRDENSFGRYDAELAAITYASAVAFFRRRLGAPAPAAAAT
jgi:carboxymethylenebutenolidase